MEEFEDTIPGIGKSVDDIVMDIRAQADRIKATRSTQKKRTNQEDQGRPAKQPKKTSNHPNARARNSTHTTTTTPGDANKILL